MADPLAAVVGERVGQRPLIGDATGWGSGTFFVVSWLLAGGTLFVTVGGSGRYVVAAGLVVALVATAIEAIGRRGWDNLFVVLGVVLVLVPLHGTPATLWSLGGGATRSESVQERALARTLRQVMANGGVAWGLLGVFAVLPPSSERARALCYVGFLGALDAAAADTWATEVGSRLAERPRSLRTLRPVPPGTSGAVSIAGTAAAVFGAASVVGTAALTGGMGANPATLALAGVAGLLGMVTDSVAGATIQAQYRDSATGALVEEPERDHDPIRGWRGVNNDVVNLFCTAVGAGAAIVLTRWIG